MIKHDRRIMLIEFLYSLLGVVLILTVRHLASTFGLFTANMASLAFFIGLLGTLIARHFAQGFTTVTTWFASLALFGIGISTSLIDASWQANLILAIMALVMLDTDCITNGYGIKTTPFLGSAFVAVIIALAICI